MAELVDAVDSKSTVGDNVRVQIPSPAFSGAKLNVSGSGFAPFCIPRRMGETAGPKEAEGSVCL